MPKRARKQQEDSLNKPHMSDHDETAVLKVVKLSENATLPQRKSDGSAGYDIYSSEKTDIFPKGKGMIKTDIAIQVPKGHYGRVAPRSSLAWKDFVDVGAGVIDEDYRGEVKVVLYNHGESLFHVKMGDRIAQLIIEKISYPEVKEVETLEETERGSGGFGSTGKE
jgi:dUTP pyrophosphatase